MKLIPFRSLVLVVSLLLTTGCSEKAVIPEVHVGDAAIDFELQDQQGHRVSLNGLLKKRKCVALVFFRSADW